MLYPKLTKSVCKILGASGFLNLLIRSPNLVLLCKQTFNQSYPEAHLRIEICSQVILEDPIKVNSYIINWRPHNEITQIVLEIRIHKPDR